MAYYEPLMKKSESLATSSTESRTLSDDELIDIEDFSSFKAYSPEMDNLLVTFNLTESSYKLGASVVAHFYSVFSTFQMEPTDMIGICPMGKPDPFLMIPISECENESDLQAISDEIIDETEIIAKKAIFNIKELPADLDNEFYFQFRYFNSIKNLIGISTPFKFHKDDIKETNSIQSNETSTQLDNVEENYDSMIMEKRDDDDFIVVSLY